MTTDQEREMLSRRRDELETQMRQRGGIRVVEELELRHVRQRLATWPGEESSTGDRPRVGGDPDPSGESTDA